MSCSSLLYVASLCRASFGEVPPAIESLATQLKGLAEWQIRNIGSDALTVPFGDSHSDKGLSYKVGTKAKYRRY